MKRREFVMLLGGAAWPLVARAQQPERTRRIGVLMNIAEDDPESSARIAAFRNTLNGLGWTEGKNLRMDIRWGIDESLIRSNAKELVALAPDVILAQANPSIAALQQATRSVPIVFVASIDPVGTGLVSSLSRPGGNATGFMSSEYGMSAKSLELLKEIAPRTTRVAVLRDPTNSAGIGQFAVIQGVAPSLGIEVSPIGLDSVGAIEQGVAAFAKGSNDGLIVIANGLAIAHRKVIIALAAQYRLPAIYSLHPFVTDGGLIAYGPSIPDQFRRAADYVDRILKGAKPADLPVQAPTKYELAINLKTAKALGITFPQTVTARADEVIE
jgi:putative tryptophan/tyrosine transport system substrate-binding protein